MKQTEFHNLTFEESAKLLSSDLKTGLTQPQVDKRLEEFGLNLLKQKKPVLPLEIFLGQFQDFIIWVLIAAALVSGFLREWVDALAIIGIVILNAILGFIQEYRAEISLAALKKLSSPTSKVIRGSRRIVIPSQGLVPGDLIELEAGDNVPADSRLIYATGNFTAQEASLTGESVPVAKTNALLGEGRMSLADRANMVYMGTSVSSGKAQALVVATGMSTELGKICGMIQGIEKETTPLQKKLAEFGKWIVYLCFVLVGLVFLLGLLRGVKALDMFLIAVSLAVAAIPEGLPAVVTIALALGVQRMVKRHALIRKLPSVETLGCTTVICSDKTGTLTKNEMTVQEVYSADLRQALICSVLCNAAELVQTEAGYKIIGDPTEGALLVYAVKSGLLKGSLEREFPFVEEIPFDPLRKKMTTIRRDKDAFIAFVKGAPDVLLEDCTKIQENGRIREINDEDRQKILKENTGLANQAMRVLGLAYKTLDKAQDKYVAGTVEKDLVFLGLTAMSDLVREEAKQAIQACKTAGIKTVMITGDHKNTAIAIARQLGFFTKDSLALTGEELDKLSDDDFYALVEHIPVYARVSPEHKLRIVQMWRKRKEVVAMTGDGVNDAPAVKEADIGVAMGITGTDVTKEVSDMVITDDNFASIVAAVEEGRGIYANIKKFVHYLLSCNAGEILVMFVSSLVGWPIPLLPVQILWVNLVTDGLPALALGVDPVEPGIMKLPPRKPNEPVVTKQRAFLMLMQGAFIAFCSLAAFCFVLFFEKEGIERARTAGFIVLSCAQLFHAFNCRSMQESLFKIGVFTNKKLILANLISFLMQMAVVYLPFLQLVFKTRPLGTLDWALVLFISSLPLWAMEAVKHFSPKGALKHYA